VKGSWPKVTASLTLRFFATHSMQKIGGPAALPHVHDYEVCFGWTHEIRPTHGYTHELGEQRERLVALVGRLREQDLNDVLPMQPSAEAIALWLLAQTEPAYCDHVIVRAYDGYEARADRALQRSEWMRFLAGRAPAPFPLK
jgi:6-pyruvoyl-tetrahydropterin synthase